MKSVHLAVPKAVYSAAALHIAAQVFAGRASISVAESDAEWELDLPEPLAGDFLNELLNQEYRFLVSALNKDAAALQVTQALFAARGGEHPAPAPSEDAAFKKKAAALLSAGGR